MAGSLREWARMADARSVVALTLSLLLPAGVAAQPTSAEPPTVAHGRVAAARPRGPRTLPFVEGERVPEGYVLQEQSGTFAVAGGAAVFGLAYLVTLIGYAVATEGCGGGDAACVDGLWPLWFPAFGPIVAIGTGRVGDGTATMLVIDGLFQSAGVGLVIYGLATDRFYWLRADLAGLRVTPLALDGGGRGLALSGRF